ncbi:hypothetical protein J4439_00730 [Candidatus Woesearchaeota archaeon]|nr:hypothetical protein [Candidatus Woesearchaeota archaeon]
MSLEVALSLAKRGLRVCYARRGILTGSVRQVYWSWDSFFASLGALALEDYAMVRSNLDLYRGHQRRDGLIPRKVTPPFYTLRFLGFRLPLEHARPKYSGAFSSDPSRIQNPLFVDALRNYIMASGDNAFLEDCLPAAEQAISWLLARDKDGDGLVEESFGQNWSETVLKRGKVLFTNVCAYRGLEAIASLAQMAGKSPQEYLDAARLLKRRIHEVFWNGSYFSDWHDGELHDSLSACGNVLASLWGIASEDEARSIHREISARGMDAVPLRTNDPAYPNALVERVTRWIGNGAYHNGLSWLWLGCADAVARHRVGLRAEARAELECIAKLIEEHGGVHEVYTQDGKPFRTTLYRAEQPFAWSAGMFVWAARLIAATE